MSKELISITDENSILITVEFLESGKILKVSDREIEHFELDLIVNENITFDQLLEAVQSGLKFRLLEKFYFDVDYDNTEFIYTDSRHPEAEMPVRNVESEEEINELLLKPGKFSFLERRRIRRSLERQKEFQDHYGNRAASGTTEIKENKIFLDPKEEKEKLKEAYIVCWNTFRECYEAYNDAFTKHTEYSELEYIKYGSPREPVIGLGAVNYSKIPDGRLLHESDIFKICLKKDTGHLKLRDLGFMTTSRLVFDPVGWHHSAALFDETFPVCDAFKNQLPHYNISERPLRKLDDEAVHIIPPTDFPEKSRQSLFMTILTPLLTIAVMISVRLFTGGKMSGISLGGVSGGMGIVTAVTAVANWIFRNKEYKERVREWRDQYQDYIRRLLDDINKKQSDDIEKLHVLYPPARQERSRQPVSSNDLVSKALSVNGDIFSRDQKHPDFLTVRIGTSTDNSELVPSVFRIIGDKKEAVFASVKYHNILNRAGYPFGIILSEEDFSGMKEDGSMGYLIDLPSDISKTYGFLKNAPVMINLKECGTLGIVVDEGDDYQLLLSNFLLNLCFYHSPDDLQIVMFCKESQDWHVRQETIRRYKHLPHFRELLGNLSAFAFNKDDAYLIFNKLLEILSERKSGEAGIKYAHIIVIVEDEYEIKRHPVSEYLPEFQEGNKKENYNISFIFCKNFMEELPRYCGKIIKKVSNGNKAKWYLLPHKQLITRGTEADKLLDESRYLFMPDSFPPRTKDIGNQKENDRYYRAFKSISALHYERIAQGADVPSNVDLIDLFENDGNTRFDPEIELDEQLKEYLITSWGIKSAGDSMKCEPKRDVTKSLAVPLGLKGGGLVELDLHEKGDGPHMLVAGTTGSGKTETVLTFLINLCTLYTPEQVNLLLIDMKGAGFVQRIGQGENRLPHVVGTVTDISGDETGTGTAYMLKRFLQSMSAEVKRRKLKLKKMDVDNVDDYTKARMDLDAHISNHEKLTEMKEDLEKMPPLPHLFLVIDEFSELMKFTSENGDVDFKSEITSLARIGRSLGFHIILISQNIENAITSDIRANSRARLCLKVATRDASREMIGTDLAASPLMPGNGRAYLLVGTGSRFEYFQSGYSGADISRNMEAPVIITYAETSGEYSLFYNSEEYAKKEKEHKKKEIFNRENGADKNDIATKKGKADITQLKALVTQIKLQDEICREKGLWDEPHCVFQQPLPIACFYDYDWENGTGNCIILEEVNEKTGEI